MTTRYCESPICTCDIQPGEDRLVVYRFAQLKTTWQCFCNDKCLRDYLEHETYRDCETFGCDGQTEEMTQVAPGTNLWLCEECKRGQV